ARARQRDRGVRGQRRAALRPGAPSVPPGRRQPREGQRGQGGVEPGERGGTKDAPGDDRRSGRDDAAVGGVGDRPGAVPRRGRPAAEPSGGGAVAGGAGEDRRRAVERVAEGGGRIMRLLPLLQNDALEKVSRGFREYSESQ